MPDFREVVDIVSLTIDAMGVLVIVLGLLAAVSHYVRSRHQSEAYRRLRRNLGRGILLGLEFLVAADIIRSVAVPPTMQGVLVLAVIVVIRTFLSVALEVELEGRWPWRRAGEHRTGKGRTDDAATD